MVRNIINCRDELIIRPDGLLIRPNELLIHLEELLSWLLTEFSRPGSK